MASRFTELYRLPQNLYCAEAPVVVAAGVLLKDNESGSVLAQLKFKSIFAASIKALKLKLSAFDVSGAEVRGVDDYQYLDLAAKRGQYFGEDKAILLPDPVARSFSIAGISVIFVDGTAWELSDGADLAAIPEQKTLVGVLGDKELAEQYQREVNSRAVNVPTEYLGIWRCACGEINRYETCTKCGAQKKKVFAAMDASALQKGLDAHLEKERQKAEEKARLEAEQAELKAKKAAELKAKGKKAAKMGVVAAVLVAVIVAAALVVTKVVIPSGKYNDAVELMESGSYTEAIAAFEALGGYKDSVAKKSECWNLGLDQAYNKALVLMDEGNYAEAIAVFESLGDYKDSADKMKESYASVVELRNEYNLPRIAAGAYHTVGLKADGTVVAVGWNPYGQCDVFSWSDIVAVSVYGGGQHTVGLKADGTVVATGNNAFGQCNVSSWSDIVAIAAGGTYTVGLKADGTVVAVGDNEDGQCNVSKWRDIVAISASSRHVVGLKADGTVVAVGDNEYGQCDVSSYSNIVEVSAGFQYTVGLKPDGTVVASGKNDMNQCNVSDWDDIVAIETVAYTVGLKPDGAVVAVGNNEYGQCDDVSGWSDIIAISAGAGHTVGLKADGTVVAVGWNDKGQCDVGDWDLF